MPVFKNQDNRSYTILPKGEYPFTVTAMESGIQTGTGKTAGSPFWELKLELERGEERGQSYKRLIDHPSCDFNIDTFLKSTNAAPPNGVPFDFVQETAESAGILWIDPIGLRGHAFVTVEEYTPKGSTDKRQRNEVVSFLTNKPKLQRREQPKPDEQSATPPASAEEVDDIPF